MFIAPDTAIYLIAGLVTVAVLWRIASEYLRVYLRAPKSGWRDVVLLAAKSGAPIPAKLRSGALRRQLVLESRNPALLTNLGEMSAASLPAKPTPVEGRKIWGFLHPNAAAGGGGERVLWMAIKATLEDPRHVVALYVDGSKRMSAAALIEQAGARFGITYSSNESSRIVVIALTQAWLADASTYKRLTLISQAVGMMVLGYEAISNLVPDVLVDTTGLAFAYPVVSWAARIPIVTYTHFPFVQDEMLGTLKWWSPKRVYWRAMMLAYRLAGSYATKVTANSTWTSKHLSKVWKLSSVEVVYPPVGVQDFTVDWNMKRSPAIVYVAQFRPEKRHELLIHAFAKIRTAARKRLGTKPHLILIGSVRDETDALQVAALQQIARKQYELTDEDFTIVQNAPWTAVRRILETSSVGANTMWNEHFGMGIVESMAAGLIPVAHASAGPLLDIVRDDEGVPGFLFASARDPDYVSGKWPLLSECLLDALTLSTSDQLQLRKRAYAAAQRFSDDAFINAWSKVVEAVDAVEPQFRNARIKAGLFD